MKKHKKNIEGSSLVECVAALAMFSLSAMILLVGFLTAGKLIILASEISQTTADVMNTLESEKLVGSSEYFESEVQNLTFTFEATTYTVEGTFKSAKSNEYKLTEFVTKKTDAPSNVIPDTDKPTNGKWPEYDDFENQYASYIIPEGTTFVYEGKYYIAAQTLKIYPRGSIPTEGWWANQNNNLIEISDRPVIYWSGGTHEEFHKACAPMLNAGDKIFWNGNYYVHTINGQSWPIRPEESLNLLQKIDYPFK